MGVQIFTSSETQSELLRLDLGDIFGIQLLRLILLAVGDGLVCINSGVPAWVLNAVWRAVSLLQRFHIVAASRLGLTYTEEVLGNGTCFF